VARGGGWGGASGGAHSSCGPRRGKGRPRWRHAAANGEVAAPRAGGGLGQAAAGGPDAAAAVGGRGGGSVDTAGHGQQWRQRWPAASAVAGMCRTGNGLDGLGRL